MWDLALRNLWRAKGRTALLALAIGAVISAALLSALFSEGMQQSRIDTAISRDLGDVQIHRVGYLEDGGQDLTIDGALELRESIQHLPGVAAVSPRGEVSGLLASPWGVSSARLLGVDPAWEMPLTSVDEGLREGTFLERETEMVVGRSLADKLRLGLGDRLTVTFATAGGELAGAAFRIGGIFESGDTSFDKTTVYVGLNAFQDMTGFADRVQEIALTARRSEKSADRVAEALRAALAGRGLDVRTWEEVQPDLRSLAALTRGFTSFFVVITLVAVAAVLVNVMAMVVQERRRELGVLKAIGMRERLVARMIALEVLFLTALGALSGALIVGGLMLATSGGISLGGRREGLAARGIQERVFLTMHPETLSMVLVCLALAMVFVAWLSGRRTRRVKLPEAVRDL